MKRIKPLLKPSSLRMNILCMLVLVTIVLYTSLVLYYSNVKKILIKTETSHTTAILDQITQQVNTVSSEAQNIALMLSNNEWSKQLLKGGHASELYLNYKSLSKMVFGIRTANSTITNIALINNKQKVIGFDHRYPRTIDYLQQQYPFIDTIKPLTVQIPDSYEGSGTYAYIFPVINTDLGSHFGNKLGSIIVYCDIESLHSALEKALPEETSTCLFILDSRNSIVTAVGTNPDNEKLESIVSKLEEGTDPKTIKDALVISKALAPEGWRIISITPLKEIEDSLIHLKRLTLTSVAVILLIIVFISIKTLGEIAYPIKKMVSFVKKGEFTSSRLVIQAPKEIGQIAYYINLMLDQTDEITKELLANKEALYELEIAQKQAEIAALTSQINPHFLYNTLNCIAGYGYTLGNQDIADVATSLSSLLRYSIKGADFVTVGEEIKTIQEYLNIMKIRFPGRYQIEYNLTENLMDIKIPRLILQPFVENSIKHGSKSTDSPLKITLNSYTNTNAEICFDIIDNGCGLPPMEIQRINAEFCASTIQSPVTTENKDSIGMANIVQRLKLLYGKEYGIQLQSNPGGGLIVHVHIPLKA